MRTFLKGRIPIKIWASFVEDGAIKQAVNLSNLDFAFKHISLMPDVHEGYGMPIGGVLASDGVITPNAVGVDIGCGVTAIRTDISNVTTEQVKKIISKAKKLIPVGFKHHQRAQEWEGFDQTPPIQSVTLEIESARRQLGTLGSGNHFCSIERGSDGFIWLMVHSGSRNIGYRVAHYYNNLAKKLNKRLRLVPEEYDLASLIFDSDEGQEYFLAMKFCLQFAKANRDLIMSRFFGAFSEVTGSKKIESELDIHHNYAALENHFHRQVIVHRKGATRAMAGQGGVIPGSMGTPSYIVSGLGNAESFMSCSHGAGRIMSRKRANQVISRELADNSMRGIVFGSWRKDYSEAPAAYKDIEEVMENQKDLVRPMVKLTPLGVMKG